MLAFDKPKKSFAVGKNGHFLLEISHIGAVLGACVILALTTRGPSVLEIAHLD